MTHAVYGNGGVLAAMSNARLADEDARRRAELDELIKADTCPYCRHSLLGALPPAGTKRKRHCNRRACVAAAASEQTRHIESLEVLEGVHCSRLR